MPREKPLLLVLFKIILVESNVVVHLAKGLNNEKTVIYDTT